MKRIKQSPGEILDSLTASGLTKTQIAAKLGIAPRTLRSYKDYFYGYRGNKHNRTPPQSVINNLKKLAHKKKLRTTIDIKENVLYEVFVKYVITIIEETSISKEYRTKLFHIPSFELETLTTLKFKKLLSSEIYAVYDTYSYIVQDLVILNWQVRKQIPFGK